MAQDLFKKYSVDDPVEQKIKVSTGSGSAVFLSEFQERNKTDWCVRYCYDNPSEIGDFPFGIIWDSKRRDDIEKLMRLDSTASWLLDKLKAHALTVLLVKCLAPDELLAKRTVMWAAYHHIQGHPDSIASSFIHLLTNRADNCLAETYAHEAKHYYQYQLAPLSQNTPLSALDEVLLRLVREGDARAIQRKVAWNIARKTGIRNVDAQYIINRFEQNYSAPELSHSAHATKIKKATQAEFINFIKEELTNPVYTAEHTNQMILRSKTLIARPADIEQSYFLSTDFLTRLSQLSSTAHYLDAESSAEIREIFVDMLPGALTTSYAKLFYPRLVL